MGDYISFLTVSIILFLAISLPIFIYLMKHMKIYRAMKEEEKMYESLFEETDEQFAARIAKEILEKHAKKIADKKEQS